MLAQYEVFAYTLATALHFPQASDLPCKILILFYLFLLLVGYRTSPRRYTLRTSTPAIYSQDIYHPDIYPRTFTPSTLTPSTLTPSTLIPSTLTPSTLTPSTLSPSTLTPSTLPPRTFTPGLLPLNVYDGLDRDTMYQEN